MVAYCHVNRLSPGVPHHRRNWYYQRLLKLLMRCQRTLFVSTRLFFLVEFIPYFLGGAHSTRIRSVSIERKKIIRIRTKSVYSEKNQKWIWREKSRPVPGSQFSNFLGLRFSPSTQARNQTMLRCHNGLLWLVSWCRIIERERSHYSVVRKWTMIDWMCCFLLTYLWTICFDLLDSAWLQRILNELRTKEKLLTDLKSKQVDKNIVLVV